MLAVVACVFVVGFATIPGDAQGNVLESRERWTPPSTKPAFGDYDYDHDHKYSYNYRLPQTVYNACGQMDDPCEHSACCSGYVCTTYPHDVLHDIFRRALKYCTKPRQL